MKKPLLNVNLNNDFLSIKTASGYFNFLDDPDVPEYLLAPNTKDDIVGQTILDALSRSRILNPYENPDFYDFTSASLRYEQWVRRKMKDYGYKSRRAMFKDMKSVSTYIQDKAIIMEPSNHVKLEAWSRERGDGIKDVSIPAGSNAIEVGVALREAFRRCL